MGAWGMSTGGRLLFPPPPLPGWINHYVFHTEFPEARNWMQWDEKDWHKITQSSNWTEIVSKLIEWHGLKAKVAVFPDGADQYTKQPEYPQFQT